MTVSLVFALGNSSDAFLVLRARDLGLSNIAAVSAYILFNGVYAVVAMPAGIASDRLGRRNVLVLGFLLFGLSYLGFGLATSGPAVWPLFAAYGFYMGLTDGVSRAFVADTVASRDRATALGVYTGAMGGMILLSSVLAGLLWDRIGPAAPFFLGGTTAAVALLGTLTMLPGRHPAAA